MSVESKKSLSTIVYYTLAVLTMLAAGFFLYALIIKDVAMWAKVVYYIWIALVFGIVIFDIICTNNGEAKKTSGMVVYILSLLALIMTCVLYFMNTGMDGLATSFFNLFISISMLAMITSGFLIATWCVGERLVDYKSVNKDLEQTKM